jgi:hypothetical protein
MATDPMPEDLTPQVVITTEFVIAALTADADEADPAVADHTPSHSAVLNLTAKSEYQDLEVLPLELAVVALLVQLVLLLVALLMELAVLALLAVLVVLTEPLAVLLPVEPLVVLLAVLVVPAELLPVEPLALLVVLELLASVLLVLQEMPLDSKVFKVLMALV